MAIRHRIANPPIPQNHWPKYDDTHNSFYGGWHAWAFVNDTDFKKHRVQYNETIQWLQQHVPDWVGDAQWKKVNDCFYIRLKHDQDAILFTLKYGPPNYEA